MARWWIINQRTHKHTDVLCKQKHTLSSLFLNFQSMSPIHQSQKLRRNIRRTIMMICVHCNDYDSRFSSIPQGTVMCWMRSSATMKQGMSSLLSHRWEMNKKHWSLNPGTLAFYPTVTVICRRGHSGSSGQQSPEFTLVRGKLRVALGSTQIFIQMTYLYENFLLCVYANFDSISFSNIIHVHTVYAIHKMILADCFHHENVTR